MIGLNLQEYFINLMWIFKAKDTKELKIMKMNLINKCLN